MAEYVCRYVIEKKIEANSEEEAREIFRNGLEDCFYCMISPTDIESEPTKGD